MQHVLCVLLRRRGGSGFRGADAEGNPRPLFRRHFGLLLLRSEEIYPLFPPERQMQSRYQRASGRSEEETEFAVNLLPIQCKKTNGRSLAPSLVSFTTQSCPTQHIFPSPSRSLVLDDGRERNSLWIGWAETINQRGSEGGRKERERGSIRGRLVFYSPDERRNGDGDAGGKAGAGEDG